jgi:MscS family membrane protein
MEALVNTIRTSLEHEELVDPESIRVHFLTFNNCSLDIDIKALVRTIDPAEYRAVVQRLNLSFMKIVEDNGTGFAFPSQTVYLARDTAPRK